MADEQQEWGRDRKGDIKDVPLGPASLVGSWFMRVDDGIVMWQGLVVGEPQPGVYLLELQNEFGQSYAQRLVPADFMTCLIGEDMEFRFYDSEAWMKRDRLGIRLQERSDNT